MELTYDETLQLGNSKEHLKTVLANIRIANEELTEVLKKVEDSKLELARLDKQATEIQEKNLIEFKKSIVIESFSQSLTEKIASLTPVLDNLIIQVKIKEDHIKSIDRELSELNSKYGTTIEIKEKEVSSLTEEILTLGKEKESIEEKVRERFNLSHRIEVEINELRHKKDSEEKILRELVLEANRQLGLVKQEIEEEKLKITNPLRLIEEENRKLDKRYRNLEILESRLRKQFRALNPDKVLPLEIKEN